jgi:hypothetical protein
MESLIVFDGLYYLVTQHFVKACCGFLLKSRSHMAIEVQRG